LKSYLYDVSDMEQTKAFAADVLRTTTQLDGLVNNAGVFSESFTKTREGLEMTFAVNVAAPFILTCSLLPLLRSTPQSRILNVASISQGGKIELDNLQYERGGWSTHQSYSVSKLHMAAFSNELARRITPDESLVMSCDPGTVNTKMLIAGWGECGIDVSVAGDELKLTTSEWREENHGVYFVGCRKSVCARDVSDETLRVRLWGALERITQCTIPAKC
jgi:NAD(P)-dependent dehydrogenase (short-subunit alcohol dehydrogenase family)